jgi:Fe-S cluster biogenesis protein NfuA
MEDERSQAVRAVIDGVLAPLVAHDGGVLEFVSLDGSAATVRLHGACSGCPGRSLTIEQVILPALKRVAANIERVELELTW